MFVPPQADSVELVPQSGMDEEYDAVSGEIDSLEQELEEGLRKLGKKYKYVFTRLC